MLTFWEIVLVAALPIDETTGSRTVLVRIRIFETKAVHRPILWQDKDEVWILLANSLGYSLFPCHLVQDCWPKGHRDLTHGRIRLQKAEPTDTGTLQHGQVVGQNILVHMKVAVSPMATDQETARYAGFHVLFERSQLVPQVSRIGDADLGVRP